MTLPRLLHPVPTRIQSFEPTETIQDSIYNEPVQNTAYSETWTIPGQWKWFASKDLRQKQYGAEEGEDGYVLLRRFDLAGLGKVIKRSDRIIGYGSGNGQVDLDVYVIKLAHEAHYADQGGSALVKVFFSDRQPGRQTPGI